MTAPAKKQSIPNIYLFVGSDNFSIAEKVAAWKERFAEKYSASAISVFDCEEMASAGSGTVSQSESVPYFSLLKTALSGHTLFCATSLIVVRNVFSKKATAIQELLCTLLPTLHEQTFLVLTDDGRDTRTELSKLLTQLVKKGACSIEEFIVPAGAALKKWVANRAARYHGLFDSKALLFFCEILVRRGTDSDEDFSPISLWQVDNEIRKLVSYAETRPVNTDDIHALACLTFSSHVFDLSDALLERREQQALIFSHRIIGPYRSASTAPLLRTLAFLASQFRSFCILKGMREDNLSPEESASYLSWNPRRTWVVEKKLASWSFYSLTNAYRHLLACEKRIKSGSNSQLLSLALCIQSLSRENKSNPRF